MQNISSVISSMSIAVFFILSSVCHPEKVDGLIAQAGYIYPHPPAPPVQLAEPQPLPPLYLPPIFSDEVPQLGYLPPNQPSPMYPSDDTVVIPAHPPNPTLQPPYLRIENMSCVQGVSFQAMFSVGNNLPNFPVVEEATEGCVNSVGENRFKIDLNNFKNMLKCGVKRCTSSGMETQRENPGNLQVDGNMCVMVRMATVRGVRLPEDGIVTLMCTPQERVVSQTKHVKLGSRKIQHISRARSNAGVIATGGSQKDLKTRIGIFRKQPGGQAYDQKVQSDSVLELGENLLLRTVVNEGDGWKNSLIGPVLITGLNSKKTALLVNQQGCVNPEMRSICPKHPQKINPLITELQFRAFLFQDSPQGDEMVVSVRTQGCLNVADCSKDQFCLDTSNSRTKRNLPIETYNRNNSEHVENVDIQDWETQFKFKVEPISHRATASNSTRNFYFFALLFLSLVAVIFSLVAFILVRRCDYRS